jgi:group II intron reverse transcriptase/maturase
MTKGSTGETVDGMSLEKINAIIDLLRQERYQWRPTRRTYIAKKNGKLRPLGIPTWSDKLVQEVLRMILEAYYEPKFSNLSHGFRSGRSCHTALGQVQATWKGTAWFIEGDIKGCFDNINHDVLLGILRRDLNDGRILRLISEMFKAGYVSEDWRYHETLSGTPQGGIISPLLANIYLNELDRFIEDTLIPTYSRGEERPKNPEYQRLIRLRREAKQAGDRELYRELTDQFRRTPAMAIADNRFRRLRYVRYADDFLLGFTGPKNEAEQIRERISTFLAATLKLELSLEKTLVTHARSEAAKFLGYEIRTAKSDDKLTTSLHNGVRRKVRAASGCIGLLMPRSVVTRVLNSYSLNGKVIHRNELVDDTDYTIVSRYQSVMRGMYNFYSMATNVSNRMGRINGILRTSLLKTLARKHQCRRSHILKKYRGRDIDNRSIIRVVIEREQKKPLIAIFGGIPFTRQPNGIGIGEYSHKIEWHRPATSRTEVVQRLLAGHCELCGREDVPLSAHHVRKLADLKRKGRSPARWQQIMSARKRKTLMVCTDCHRAIHSGRHDGAKLTGRKNTGEPDAVKVASPVRRGAVGNVPVIQKNSESVSE